MKRASVLIEEICPQQSLVLYFNNMGADFQQKNDVSSCKLRNSDCGIEHILPGEVRPLVEIKAGPQ